jgi:uncharacterized membrane protein (DUF485 family)
VTEVPPAGGDQVDGRGDGSRADASPADGSPTGGAADRPSAKPPARVRVTAPTAGALPEASVAESRAAARTTDAMREADATDVPAVYVRSLIRSQLRLALVCAGGFVAATTLFVLAIVWAPALDETFVAGVPVSWLLLAAGVYPLALTIAALYVRAATRNEARYRSLAEES